MLKFGSFTGINNTAPEHRVPAAGLHAAVNVDVGLTGEMTRRDGYRSESELCHKNLWQAAGFMLATVGGVLTAIHPDGGRQVVHPAFGAERVWYCNLPDGRTTYTNGLLHGMTFGAAGTDWSVPSVPTDPLPEQGAAFGALYSGAYRVFLTHRRLTDGAESPAAELPGFQVSDGGLRIDGLRCAEGHEVLVYLSGLDGEGAYLAGSTQGDSFVFTGANADLVLPCRTVGAVSFPVGTYTAHWRGRVLTAVGNTLWASRAATPHLADWRDFKPMASGITGIAPVGNGVFIGTEHALVFLRGDSFDTLQYSETARGGVVRGSMVLAPGPRLKRGEGAGDGPAMVCLAGGEVVAGFADGGTFELSNGAYRNTPSEVAATFREVRGVPQYLAVPQ